VILLLVGTVLTGAFWSISTPVGSSPDEVFHLGSIWCAQGNSAHCELPANAEGWRQTAKVPAFIAGAACFRVGPIQTRPYESAVCQKAVENDPALADTIINHAGGYPGGFYSFMSMFVGPSIQLSVILMRLVNVLLFVGLLASALFFVARRLRQSVLLTAAIGLVPVGFFLVFSVNPSAWALMGILFYWVFLSELIVTPPSWRRTTPLVALTIITGLLAVTSRSDSALYLGIVTVAAALQWLNPRELRRRFDLLVPVALSAWGAVVYLTSSQISHETGVKEAAGVGLLVRNFVEMPQWIFGNFGFSGTPTWPLGLSWFDVPVPVIVPGLVVMCLGGVSFLLRGNWGWRKITAFAFTSGMFVLLPVLALQKRGWTGQGWMQPRYILPLILVAIAILWTTRTNDDEPIISGRARSWFLIASLTVAMSASQYVLIRRFVSGLNGRLISLSNGAQWWWHGLPLSPDLVWILGTLATGVMFYGLIHASRLSQVRSLPSGS